MFGRWAWKKGVRAMWYRDKKTGRSSMGPRLEEDKVKLASRDLCLVLRFQQSGGCCLYESRRGAGVPVAQGSAALVDSGVSFVVL